MTTRHSCLIGFLALALAATRAAWANGAPQRPNVVVILSDDVGFSDLGCYGGEIPTPNLDSLAKNGVRLTRFYNTARCCPTRASLLTGLYPHQAGMGHMTGNDHGGKNPGFAGDLSPDCRTIAEVLGPAGYRNYAVGKWHVCNSVTQNGPRHNWPLQRGFQSFYGIISGGGSYFDPWTLCRDNRLISPFADPDYKPETFYLTDAITDHAVRSIDSHHREHPGKPFFLYVSYTAAHWPLHALPEDIARHKGRYKAGYEAVSSARLAKARALGIIDPDQKPAPLPIAWDSVANKEREEACMEVYAAMLERMDMGIGRIVDRLKAGGSLDNTLVLYMQDNGACAEEQGRRKLPLRLDGPRPAKPTLPPRKPEALPGALVPIQTRDGFPVRQGPSVMPGPADTYLGYGKGWAAVGNTPFREYKHWVHEGGISTPLIAHWPRGIKAKGELRSTPGHLIDIMATCVEAAGATYPAGAPPLEGASLLPVFQGKGLPDRALFWEHEGNRAVAIGDWKAVANGPAGEWELYNLKGDRVEATNLAGAQPERLRALVGRWEAYAKRAKVLPWVWDPPYKEYR
ncbi:MAG: arylsulfatase [Planctomycetes bacterium]|nr:arylsulfatase [Planctomycetota bacterium]